MFRVVTCCALWLAAAVPAVAAESLSDLTGPWILLVDDHPVAAKDQLVRTYHPFEKHPDNPVLPGDKPWEHDLVYVYGTSLPDEIGQGYRLWYHGLPAAHEDDKYRLLYATSTDGIEWYKPSLGIVSWFGSTNNNIFLRRTGRDHIPSIIHTPWDSNPNKRYRMINWDSLDNGYFGAYSADGIHWTDSPVNPLFRSGGDVGQFVWDPHTQRYLGYVKLGADVRGMRRRSVGFTTSTDFETWSDPTLILAPDDFDDRWTSDFIGTPRTHFYGMSSFAYESMYIGFLWVFRAIDYEGYYDGPIFVEMVTSHDGVNWLRQEGDRPPILELGPYGSWDDGMLFTTNHPIVEGDTIRLYYGGCDGLHAGPIDSWIAGIGLATLRKDGFASLDAGATPGTVTTKRLANAQGPLRVNADAAGGWLTAEVLDEQGQVIPGYASHECNALQGDAVDATITWQNRTELPVGYPAIRLRFVYQNASLYSFMAGGDVSLLDEPHVVLESLATFEGYAGTTAPDQRWQDGAQAITFHGASAVETDPAHARFGQHAARLSDASAAIGWLELADTANLSTEFTLAAFVKSEVYRQAQLFSTDDGDGEVGTSELVFRFDPSGTGLPGLRLICKGIIVDSLPVTFDDGAYHHLAATYNQGLVNLYLDGNLVGQGRVGGGAPILLDRHLHVGRDAESETWQRFIGWLDDVLVLQRELSPQEVASLAQLGGEAFFGIGAVPGDLSDDGIVDEGDCAMLRDAMRSFVGAPEFIPTADHDGNGRLDCADAEAWLADYRAYAGDPNAPDPCGLADPTDSDGDGVRDLCDFCPGTIGGVPVDTSGCRIDIPGDLDGDGDVDMDDFGWFQVCLTGPDVPQDDPACQSAKLAGNESVDASDQALFGQCLSGADITGDPNCTGETGTFPPSITQHPIDQSVAPGESVIFTVTADGTVPRIYQWQKNGVNLVDGGKMTGAATASLEVADCQTTDAGDYRCVVMNTYGSATSNAATLEVSFVTPDFCFTNNDFETFTAGVADDWTQSGSEAIFSASTDSYSGNYAQEIKWTSGGAKVSALYQHVWVEVGVPYTVKAYFRMNDTKRVNGTIRVDFNGGTDPNIFHIGDSAPRASWGSKTLTFTKTIGSSGWATVFVGGYGSSVQAYDWCRADLVTPACD